MEAETGVINNGALELAHTSPDYVHLFTVPPSRTSNRYL